MRLQRETQKIRVQTVQEVRLPVGSIIEFPLQAEYKRRNNTLEGVKGALAPVPPDPNGDVEPLMLRTVDDDDAEFVDEVVGTSNLIAQHRARNAPDGVVEQPSVNSTPPTEVATPPGELAAPPAEAPGGENQPLGTQREHDDLHGSDTDDESALDKPRHKHPAIIHN